MATGPIPKTIEMLSQEKGIDQEVIISAIEDAVLAAARKHFKSGEDLRARYNRETGEVEVFALKRVVEQVEDPATEISLEEAREVAGEDAEVGDLLELYKPREELGRIAAQTAKQVIFQKIREAERDNVFREYKDRIGELIHGFVKRFEGPNIIVEIGKLEAILPKSEQVIVRSEDGALRGESFSQGERIRVIIKAVSNRNEYLYLDDQLGEKIHLFFGAREGKLPASCDCGAVVHALATISPKEVQVEILSITLQQVPKHLIEDLRAVARSVPRDMKGPQIEVSRTSPALLKRLFEMEVPEIYDGTVQIKAAVREPGERAKIAVASRERDVDPVGACVGMKGSRVQTIIRELRGERIDIIEWNEDPAIFAANALSPAKISKVEINSFDEKRMTVTVPEDQQSLAIGKRGQNVRLAAKLVGWHIDIRSTEEAARAAAAQLEAVMTGSEARITNVRESLALDQITAERLRDYGIETIEQLAAASVDDIVDAIDVSFDEANSIIERARRLLAQRQARAAQAAKEQGAGPAQEESTAETELSAEPTSQEEQAL
jgi:N utilization substance protein A